MKSNRSIVNMALVLGTLTLAQCIYSTAVIEKPDICHAREDILRSSNSDCLFWSFSSFPLVIKLHPDIAVHKKFAVKLAAEIWNTTVEQEVFIVAETFSSHVTEYSYGVISFSLAEALAPVSDQRIIGKSYPRHFSTGLTIRCDVFVLQEIENPLELSLVVVHELGHCLGLGHDEKDVLSIMHPRISLSEKLIASDDIAYVREQMAVNE